MLHMIVPLSLLLLFHFLYIKAGMYAALFIKKKSFKVLFWLLYGGFGVVLVYTNYIWNDVNNPAFEDIYKDNLVINSDSNATFSMAGNIDPRQKMVLLASLRTDSAQCRKESMQNSLVYKYIVYPKTSSKEYSLDILKEYVDAKTECHYSLERLSAFLYYEDFKHDRVNLFLRGFGANDGYFDVVHIYVGDLLQRGKADIVCAEKPYDLDDFPYKSQSHCQLSLASLREDSSPRHTLGLDVKIEGEISGRSFYNVEKKWPSFVLDKFQIFGYSSL